MDEQKALTAMAGEELERELRAYAGARLSPDRFASHRMRTAVTEHARTAMPTAVAVSRFGRPARFRIGVRRAGFVALVGLLAIGTGSVAGAATVPGGPLYPVRVWIETALLPAGGEARTDAQQALLNERINEINGALGTGDRAATDAASNAYDQEVDQAVAQAAQNRAVLVALRGTVVRHLAHLQTLVKPNDKSSAQLQRLIAAAQASLADIDARIAALPQPTP